MTDKPSDWTQLYRYVRLVLVVFFLYMAYIGTVKQFRYAYDAERLVRIERTEGVVERYDPKAFKWVPLGRWAEHRREQDALEALDGR